MEIQRIMFLTVSFIQIVPRVVLQITRLRDNQTGKSFLINLSDCFVFLIDKNMIVDGS